MVSGRSSGGPYRTAYGHLGATCMSLCTVSPAQRDAKWHHGCITDKAKARGYLNANSGLVRVIDW